jgi:hypothetical protein
VQPSSDGSLLAIGKESWGTAEDSGGPSGIDLWDISDTSAPRRVATIAPPREEDETYRVNFRIRTTEGTLHWLEARGAVVYEDGEPRRMIGVQTDITDEKRVDRVLEVIRRSRDVILRAETQDELLRGVCRQLVQAPGYELAWVGTPGDDGLAPTAWAGKSSEP